MTLATSFPSCKGKEMGETRLARQGDRYGQEAQ